MANSLENQFKDLFTRTINKKTITDNIRNDLGSWIKSKDSSLNVSNVGDDILSISYSLMQDEASKNDINFIDLKPYFERSSKVKRTKNGGWYMVIPISNSATKLRSAYGRSLWDRISHTDFGSTSSEGDINRIQSTLGVSQDATIPELQYAWKSNNVTRVQWGASGKRGKYIQFRTVSNKSDPNSWIVGRQAFNQDTPDIEKLAPYISTILLDNAKKHLDATSLIL